MVYVRLAVSRKIVYYIIIINNNTDSELITSKVDYCSQVSQAVLSNRTRTIFSCHSGQVDCSLDAMITFSVDSFIMSMNLMEQFVLFF